MLPGWEASRGGTLDPINYFLKRNTSPGGKHGQDVGADSGFNVTCSPTSKQLGV